jgi:HTH-type transcriptional regulator/antitoxin HigA
MTILANPPSYAELLAAHQPRPIRNKREHQRLLRLAESLTRPDISRDEAVFLDLIGGLIEEYEAENFPVPDATPAQVLEHLLDARQLSQAEFARQAKVSRQLITDILKRRRSITAEHIRTFADFFGVSPTVFVPRG